jgi:hypothetical protein
MADPQIITLEEIPHLNLDSSLFRVYRDGLQVGTVRIMGSQMTRRYLMDDIVRWCELNFSRLSTSEETNADLDELRLG